MPFLKKIKLFLLFFILPSVLLLTGIFSYSFYISSREKKRFTQQKEKSIDLVSIFTGDEGRIEFGLREALRIKAKRIFISGVYNKNSMERVLAKIKQNLNHSPKDFNHLKKILEIDYYSRNTIENVISTLHFMNKHRELKNVLIISHDYHLLRIRTILSSVRGNEKMDHFYFLGIKSSLKNYRQLKVYFKEGLKYIQSCLLFLIWDAELSFL